MTGTAEARDFLRKRNDFVSAAVVLLHVAVVFAPLVLALQLPLGWPLLLCAAAFGVGMNGLLNLLHECAHLHVFRKPALSVALGRWFLGPLVLADFDGYQKRHWQHHRDLGKDTDPKYVYRTDIRGRRFFIFLLRCLFLLEAVKKFSVQTPGGREAAPASGGFGWVLRVLLAHAVLFGALFGGAFLRSESLLASFTKAAVVYGGVYLYGIAGVTVWVSSLRAIAEHQTRPDGSLTEGNAALRNFSYGIFTGFVLGAYGFQDHASHHHEPGIPYYRLKSKSLELARENAAFSPAKSYEKVLFSLTR